MQLPTLEVPPRYRGLYVFDFGQWCSVGYTADEISMLLESEEYRAGKVYKILNATQEGLIELRGIPRTQFDTESGMFFYRGDLKLAREDFATLRAISETTPPPCRAFIHLVERGPDADTWRYCTALIYPTEFDDDISRWLLANAYYGGDTVEGGASHVTNFRTEQHALLDHTQLWSNQSVPSRSPAEVFGNVRMAVQR